MTGPLGRPLGGEGGDPLNHWGAARRYPGVSSQGQLNVCLSHDRRLAEVSHVGI